MGPRTFHRLTLSATSPGSPSTAAGPIIGPDVTAATDVKFDLSRVEILAIVAKLQGATGGVLDVYLQSFDGTDWLDFAHFTQQAAGGALVVYTLVPPKPTAVSIVTVGRNTTPVLAAAQVVAGHPGTHLRMLFVAGASTSLGAVQTVHLLGLGYG